MLDLSWIIYFLIFAQANLDTGSAHFTSREQSQFADETRHEICDGQVDFRQQAARLKLSCVSYSSQGGPWQHRSVEYLVRPDQQRIYLIDPEQQKAHFIPYKHYPALLRSFRPEGDFPAQTGVLNLQQGYTSFEIEGHQRLLQVYDLKTGLRELIHVQGEDYEIQIKAWPVQGAPRAQVFELNPKIELD